jgi:hypothetical protein
LTNEYEEEAGEDCDLKYLLMGKDKKYSVLDEIVAKGEEERHIFVRKIKRIGENGLSAFISENIGYKRGWLLKLSNSTIQLLLEDRSFLIINDRLFELTP